MRHTSRNARVLVRVESSGGASCPIRSPFTKASPTGKGITLTGPPASAFHAVRIASTRASASTLGEIQSSKAVPCPAASQLSMPPQASFTLRRDV